MGKLRLFWHRNSNKAFAYFLLAPFFGLFAVVMLWPTAYTFYLSFHKWSGFSSARFIGAANYVALLGDNRFLAALRNTTFYAAGSVFLILPFSLGIAILVNIRFVKGKNFFRAVFYVPAVMSAVIVAVIFSLIYEKNYGNLNSILARVGLGPVHWLGSGLIMLSIVGIGAWRWMGLNMLYFLTGLERISPDVREAAYIDGANRWQLFMYIDLPLLKPTFLFVIIMALTGSYQIFTEPYILAEGGPGVSSLTLVLNIYITAFRFVKFGYAAAASYVVLVIILGLSMLQFLLFGTFREKG